MRRIRSGGFTLIELMIVTAILGILAYVAITQYIGLIEKTAEGSTKAGLGTLRVSAAIYHGDREGAWPQVMDDAPAYLFSQYLTHLPVVRVTGKFDRHRQVQPMGRRVSQAQWREVPTRQDTGWMYDSNSGNVYVNSTLCDSKSVPYSYYGFE